jgi:hypothetical protein
LSTGCASSSLQLLQEPPPYLSDLRTEYFTANPDSPYRGNVSDATVVPGMGRFDVLASWGQPSQRVRTVGEEQWVYFDVDKESGDALQHELLFREGVLDKWKTRSLKNTGLGYKGRVEVPARVDESLQPPPGGKKVPKT